MTRRLGSGGFERHAVAGYTCPGKVETFDFGDIAAREGSPVAFDDHVPAVEDVPTELPVLVNDVDPAATTLRLDAVTDPPHGTATIAADAARDAPDANYNGTDSFEYTIRNAGGQPSTARVDVEVAAVNDPPTVVASVPGSASVGVAANVSALVSDPDEGDAVSLLWKRARGKSVHDRGSACRGRPRSRAPQPERSRSP